MKKLMLLAIMAMTFGSAWAQADTVTPVSNQSALQKDYSTKKDFKKGVGFGDHGWSGDILKNKFEIDTIYLAAVIRNEINTTEAKTTLLRQGAGTDVLELASLDGDGGLRLVALRDSVGSLNGYTAGRIDFATYFDGSSNLEIARIYGMYTGDSTLRSGGLIFGAYNQGELENTLCIYEDGTVAVDGSTNAQHLVENKSIRNPSNAKFQVLEGSLYAEDGIKTNGTIEADDGDFTGNLDVSGTSNLSIVNGAYFNASGMILHPSNGLYRGQSTRASLNFSNEDITYKAGDGITHFGGEHKFQVDGDEKLEINEDGLQLIDFNRPATDTLILYVNQTGSVDTLSMKSLFSARRIDTSLSIDFDSTGSLGSDLKTYAFPGADVGDRIVITAQNEFYSASAIVSAAVKQKGTISIRCHNLSDASFDPSVYVFYITIFKQL